MTNRKKRCIEPQIIKTPTEKQAMAEASKPSTFSSHQLENLFSGGPPLKEKGKGGKESRDLVTEPIGRERARKKTLRASVSSAQIFFSEREKFLLRIRV